MDGLAVKKISDEYITKWQKTVDIMSRLCEVPAGLIMRVHQKQIEVLVASYANDNPYRPGEMASLGSGLYCETVMSTREALNVPNALEDPDWMHNPDIKLGMITYLGIPLIWPDGEVFGTLCILDRKPREFHDTYLSLMLQFKELIEADFKLIEKNFKLTREIKKRKKVEHKLLHSNKQLEHRIEDLNAFSYTVSHDLRNPLNHIVAYSEILLMNQKDKLDENVVDTIEKIKKECFRGVDMMAGLYKLASFSHIKLTRQQVNLSNIAKDVANELSETTPERNVIFKIQPDVEVFADKSMLTVLLENLFGNAWKYSSKNPNAVIEFYTSRKDNDQISYCVKDNGVGFDMNQADKIFLPFSRLHGQDFEGIGIGLATVKHIIRSHDGDIHVESKLGGGTLFSFTLGHDNL